MQRHRAAALVAVLVVTPVGPAAAAGSPAPGSKQANRIVAKQLEDRRLVGARGDGAGVDWLFCANGRYESAVTSDGSTGVSKGRGWKVVDARVKQDGRWFEATVEDGSWSVAVGRHGARWLAAVDWSPFDWGDVERVPAGDAAACR